MDQYFREKFFNMLRKMRVLPGDARMRLAWASKELFIHRQALRTLELSDFDRAEVDKLLVRMEADEYHLRTAKQPMCIGNMRNSTAVRYLILLERIGANYLSES